MSFGIAKVVYMRRMNAGVVVWAIEQGPECKGVLLYGELYIKMSWRSVCKDCVWLHSRAMSQTHPRRLLYACTGGSVLAKSIST
jgi:hypothetical protein